MAKPITIESVEGRFKATEKIKSRSAVTQDLWDALEHASDVDAALNGELFDLVDSAFISDKMKTLVVIPARQTSERGSSSSSSSGGTQPVEVKYTKVVVPREEGQITSEELEIIRSFTPAAEDKLFTFTAFEPTQSSVLVHRQRVMWLLRHGFSVAQIKEAVNTKRTKLLTNRDAKTTVTGIPKRRLELCLCDSMVAEKVVTSYSRLLITLFETQCEYSDDHIQLVPDYIGIGGKSESSKPDKEETFRRRKVFLVATANYLRPLFTNAAFRAMIAVAKSHGATA